MKFQYRLSVALSSAVVAVLAYAALARATTTIQTPPLYFDDIGGNAKCMLANSSEKTF